MASLHGPPFHTLINSVFTDKTPVFKTSDWLRQLHTSHLRFKDTRSCQTCEYCYAASKWTWTSHRRV